MGHLQGGLQRKAQGGVLPHSRPHLEEVRVPEEAPGQPQQRQIRLDLGPPPPRDPHRSRLLPRSRQDGRGCRGVRFRARDEVTAPIHFDSGTAEHVVQGVGPGERRRPCGHTRGRIGGFPGVVRVARTSVVRVREAVRPGGDIVVPSGPARERRAGRRQVGRGGALPVPRARVARILAPGEAVEGIQGVDRVDRGPEERRRRREGYHHDRMAQEGTGHVGAVLGVVVLGVGHPLGVAFPVQSLHSPPRQLRPRPVRDRFRHPASPTLVVRG
mmetsp:Transcript_30677/g.91807  ORF Transcript_30677/g.91807 Transcript_30677/m.91807 type:complete len:271 (+) Transcript_30677:994-1806(+)